MKNSLANFKVLLSKCAAVGCSEKLTKEFSFQAFPFKNEARK